MKLISFHEAEITATIENLVLEAKKMQHNDKNRDRFLRRLVTVIQNSGEPTILCWILPLNDS